MNVLGIDTGFANLGWAVARLGAGGVRLVAAGTLVTKAENKKRHTFKADDDVRRTRELVKHFEELRSTWAPAALVAEMPAPGGRGARACYCKGAAMASLVTFWIATPCIWLTPEEIKTGCCGSSGASKDAVAAAVFEEWPGVDWPDRKTLVNHSTDAAGAILTAHRRGALDLLLATVGE